MTFTSPVVDNILVRRVATYVVAIALGAGAFAGCSHVKPWEREHMARIEKQLEQTEPNRQYEEHMWSVREAAAGGSGRAGGGCGCN